MIFINDPRELRAALKSLWCALGEAYDEDDCLECKNRRIKEATEYLREAIAIIERNDSDYRKHSPYYQTCTPYKETN